MSYVRKAQRLRVQIVGDGKRADVGIAVLIEVRLDELDIARPRVGGVVHDAPHIPPDEVVLVARAEEPVVVEPARVVEAVEHLADGFEIDLLRENAAAPRPQLLLAVEEHILEQPHRNAVDKAARALVPTDVLLRTDGKELVEQLFEVGERLAAQTRLVRGVELRLEVAARHVCDGVEEDLRRLGTDEVHILHPVRAVHLFEALRRDAVELPLDVGDDDGVGAVQMKEVVGEVAHGLAAARGARHQRVAQPVLLQNAQLPRPVAERRDGDARRVRRLRGAQRVAAFCGDLVHAEELRLLPGHPLGVAFDEFCVDLHARSPLKSDAAPHEGRALPVLARKIGEQLGAQEHIGQAAQAGGDRRRVRAVKVQQDEPRVAVPAL